MRSLSDRLAGTFSFSQHEIPGEVSIAASGTVAELDTEG